MLHAGLCFPTAQRNGRMVYNKFSCNNPLSVFPQLDSCNFVMFGHQELFCSSCWSLQHLLPTLWLQTVNFATLHVFFKHWTLYAAPSRRWYALVWMNRYFLHCLIAYGHVFDWPTLIGNNTEAVSENKPQEYVRVTSPNSSPWEHSHVPKCGPLTDQKPANWLTLTAFWRFLASLSGNAA